MDELRVKHLELVQGVINRLAGNSFSVKNWSVTVLAAMVGLLSGTAAKFVILALIPAFAFWGLDAYYLRQERLFRGLYEALCESARSDIEPFSMDTSSVGDAANSWLKTLIARSVLGLHLPLSVAIIGIWLFFHLSA